jgi:FtsP/CotA-like multicopper oxidase with cupredoxin domain
MWVAFGVLLSLAFSLMAALHVSGDNSAGASNRFEVDLTEFAIEPTTIHARAGAPIELDVHNNGRAIHNLAVQGAEGTEMLQPGTKTALEVGPLAAGNYELVCQVPGHADQGMKATLVVADGRDAAGSVTQPAMDAAQMDREYLAGVKAFPAKTKGIGGQRLAPKIVDGTKVFELTAAETKWEVAPGDVRDAMAYNGMVPGPEIRVALGDRVRVVLRNELSESTAMHFHGLEIPNDQDGVPGITQELVEPGRSHTYEFTVNNAGTHEYHSHMNGATQIPRGLLGAFIVEGPNEPQVDEDVNVVLNDGPLGFTINGKGFPATAPIVASPGQRVRIRYINQGLMAHPMHLHGMEQLVIAKDGWPLPQPYRADTLWVAPGERYDVIVTTRPGIWAFHCHILEHAEGAHGMFGMVTAVVVK